MKKILQSFCMMFICLAVTSMSFGQARPYEGPDDPAGDRAAIRKGYMEGNRVRLQFRNTTELSDWGTGTDPFASKWPNTNQGVKMSDGVGLMISARVFLENDSIPVDDWETIQNWNSGTQGTLDTLFFCQTNYREEMDSDPTGEILYGLYPVFGYFNENGVEETPALSDDPDSWPVLGWPSREGLKYPPAEDGSKYFNGRFGIGTEENPSNADLECYFVANDAQDQEYFEDDLPTLYSPRPGVHIGDKRSDVTIGYGKPWGGLGIRVEQRGYQWSNPESQDAIFWEYNIANISDYNINEVSFGYWVDNGVGDDGTDEIGAFDKLIDLAYSWDINGIGTGGRRTGTMGFAFLESPGIFDDSKDNDDDGLTDERRDQPLSWADPAGNWIGPEEGVSNVSKFLDFYNYKQEDLSDHWEGDEDQDWRGFDDANGNGVWDDGENPGDDVGLDGLGPDELGWEEIGRDEGETDGKPSYVAGVGCEPNFNAMDVSESDMLGLTAFQMYPINGSTKRESSGGDGSGYQWFYGDWSMFEIMASDTLMEFRENISNLVEVFASGTFPLMQGQTERISMAELHSYEPLEGLNGETHSAPALFKLKQIVQIIYERDYRFAQAPVTPTLTAVAGDGAVILTWDRAADQLTREAFLDNANDFEGYKLFKSTDKLLSEAMTVTDAHGSAIMMAPIFECDLKDDISGYADFGLVGGQGYYLGDDTGLQHFYIDSTVQNGVTYYYGLVAYDYGVPPDSLAKDATADEIQKSTGIAPSYNSIVPELDDNENIKLIPKNMAVVTPGFEAAGYKFESVVEVIDEETVLFGSGTITPEVVLPESVIEGAKYVVEFTIHIDRTHDRMYPPHGVRYTTDGMKVYRTMDGGERTLVYEDKTMEDVVGDQIPENSSTVLQDAREETDIESWHISTEGARTGIFDGIRLYVKMDTKIAELDTADTGWYPAKTPDIPVTIIPNERGIVYQGCFSWDYQIRWLAEDETPFRSLFGTGTIKDMNYENVSKSDVLNDIDIPFIVENMNFVDSTRFEVQDGDTTYLPELMDIIIVDKNGNGELDYIEDQILVGAVRPGSKPRYVATIFEMDFSEADPGNLPKPNDVFLVKYKRPFWKDDKFTFRMNVEEGVDEERIKLDMDKIKVVPNPYVGTNLMEPALENSDRNQRRRIMFTHIPQNCTIKIFTVSGVFIDEIHAPEDGLVTYNNIGETSTGVIHWDLKSHEGLDIAAGIYIFHVKDDVTGEEKVGKFAVLK